MFIGRCPCGGAAAALLRWSAAVTTEPAGQTSFASHGSVRVRFLARTLHAQLMAFSASGKAASVAKHMAASLAGTRPRVTSGSTSIMSDITPVKLHTVERPDAVHDSATSSCGMCVTSSMHAAIKRQAHLLTALAHIFRHSNIETGISVLLLSMTHPERLRSVLSRTNRSHLAAPTHLSCQRAICAANCRGLNLAAGC